MVVVVVVVVVACRVCVSGGVCVRVLRGVICVVVWLLTSRARTSTDPCATPPTRSRLVVHAACCRAPAKVDTAALALSVVVVVVLVQP